MRYYVTSATGHFSYFISELFGIQPSSMREMALVQH